MWVDNKSSSQPLMPWNLDRLPVGKHQAGEGHDQSSHGVWAAGRGGTGGASGGGATEDAPRTPSQPPVGDTISGRSAGDLQQEMLSGGGISVTFTGKSPPSGFMVSHAGSEVVVSNADMRDPAKGKAIIRDFINTNAKRLQEGRGFKGQSVSFADAPKNYFGAWFNERTDKNPNGDNMWYLDVSENISSLTDAVRVGRERNQLSIYSVNSDDVINMDSPLADYAMSREGGNPQGGSWFAPSSGRSSMTAPIDAFKAAKMEDEK